MKVQYVPLEYVHQTWPLVEGFITSALQYCQGEITPEQAKLRLADGRWELYVAVDDSGAIKGAAAVQFNNMPNDRVAHIATMGGKLITNPDNWAQFLSLLKYRGATRVEGAVRESMARFCTKYGLTEKYRVVGVSI